MNGDEQIRRLRAGAAHPIAQRHEVVAVAGQHRLHPRLGIDLERQFARNGEDHVLFTSAVLADGARILAAVAGVDGDDEVAGIGGRMLHLDRGIGALTRSQIDDQAIAVAIVGRCQKALGLNGPRQIEHDPQLTRRAPRHAHVLDGPGSGRRRARAACQARPGDIQHHAIGIPQNLQTVVGPAGQIQHHPRVIGSRPQPNGAYIDRVRGQRQHHCQQGHPHQPAAPQTSWRANLGLSDIFFKLN